MALFRDESPNLGTTTTVKEVGASSTSTTTLVTNNFKPPTREIVAVPLSAVSNTTANLTGYVFTAPWKCQVIAIRYNAAVVSSAGTAVLDIQKITADSVAPGSGTTLLASTYNLDTATAANTRVNVALTTTAASLVLNAGDQIAYNINTAPTALAGALVQIEITQLG